MSSICRGFQPSEGGGVSEGGVSEDEEGRRREQGVRMRMKEPGAVSEDDEECWKKE